MSVVLLFFAGVRDLLGRAEAQIQLPGQVNTVGQLRTWLGAEYQVLLSRLPSVRIAVNESFADDEQPLNDGDTIALIPPVSGG